MLSAVSLRKSLIKQCLGSTRKWRRRWVLHQLTGNTSCLILLGESTDAQRDSCSLNCIMSDPTACWDRKLSTRLPRRTRPSSSEPLRMLPSGPTTLSRQESGSQNLTSLPIRTVRVQSASRLTSRSRGFGGIFEDQV